ncbi:unnamed protein product, partial [Cyprideis torosa]
VDIAPDPPTIVDISVGKVDGDAAIAIPNSNFIVLPLQLPCPQLWAALIWLHVTEPQSQVQLSSPLAVAVTSPHLLLLQLQLPCPQLWAALIWLHVTEPQSQVQLSSPLAVAVTSPHLLLLQLQLPCPQLWAALIWLHVTEPQSQVQLSSPLAVAVTSPHLLLLQLQLPCPQLWAALIWLHVTEPQSQVQLSSPLAVAVTSPHLLLLQLQLPCPQLWAALIWLHVTEPQSQVQLSSPLAVAVTSPHARDLLDRIEDDGDDIPTDLEEKKVHLRNYLICAALLSTAQRPQALSELTVDQVASAKSVNGQYIVYGEKHKTVATHGPAPLSWSPADFKRLLKFIVHVRPFFLRSPEENHLFLTVTGKPVTASQISAVQKLPWADIGLNITATDVRKSTATLVRRDLPEKANSVAALMTHYPSTQEKHYQLFMRKNQHADAISAVRKLRGLPEDNVDSMDIQRFQDRISAELTVTENSVHDQPMDNEEPMEEPQGEIEDQPIETKTPEKKNPRNFPVIPSPPSKAIPSRGLSINEKLALYNVFSTVPSKKEIIEAVKNNPLLDNFRIRRPDILNTKNGYKVIYDALKDKL